MALQQAQCSLTERIWSIIGRNGYSDVGNIHVVQCHIVVVRHCSRLNISTCHVPVGFTCVWCRLRCSRFLAHSGTHIGSRAFSHASDVRPATGSRCLQTRLEHSEWAPRKATQYKLQTQRHHLTFRAHWKHGPQRCMEVEMGRAM